MPRVGQDVGIRGPLGTAGGHRYSKNTPTNFNLRKVCQGSQGQVDSVGRGRKGRSLERVTCFSPGWPEAIT